MIQKLNAEGRLEKKEAKKGSYFDKVRTYLWNNFCLLPDDSVALQILMSM